MHMKSRRQWEPLVNDQYTGEPSKRAFAYVQSKRKQGKKVIGTYCGYAPLELFRAMDAVPTVLCAFSNRTMRSGT
jgi:benzoyl-CoA reductase/2-hydroxyglutaryl-CoA dehydratase subunit BcrC/BadD/HgdB